MISGERERDGTLFSRYINEIHSKLLCNWPEKLSFGLNTQRLNRVQAESSVVQHSPGSNTVRSQWRAITDRVESPLAGRLGLMNAADHQWPNSSATYYHLIQAEWRTFSHCLDLHLSSTKPHSREEGLFCVCSLLSGEFCEASASSMELQSLTGRSSVNGASSFF